MASSSSWRRCSDAELQKALSDIDELVARRHPIPDELKSLDSKEEQKNDEKDQVKKDEMKKKKKKLVVIPPKDVKLLLSYRCDEEFPETKNLDSLAEEEKGIYQDLKTAVSAVQVLGRHYQDGIRAAQEKMRYQLLTQGYVTYEATDDEAEEEEAAAAPVQQGGGGRRRHRPGVKTAGGRARKIN